ncbi:protein DEK-like isoform X3 [Mercenaria mercenaria]|uniref:protein DEK-like isoform X3 n=1 Tax=Mercenaria mercenaria TaxID=6596 RepID=UPI00234E511C|nr:protein DEK-like isoform X3 [Mercenaria mercenaria]
MHKQRSDLSRQDNTSKEEVEAESRDTSMEHEDAETSKEKAGDKSEEESEDKEEEESDDEPQVGLLEKPLILEEGKKRERKKVERISFQSEEKAHEGLEIKEGKGRSLGDIPFIEFKLGRTKAEDCKPLHRLLYRRQGSVCIFLILLCPPSKKEGYIVLQMSVGRNVDQSVSG